MDLTPEEIQELEQLRAEFSQPQRQAQSSDLTPEELAELKQLRAEFGGDRTPGQFPVSTLPPDKGIVLEGQATGQTTQKGFLDTLADKAQTQLESFGNAVSFGYLPHLQAAFEKINPDPSGGLDDQLRAQGFTVPDQSYVSLRDENIERQEAQARRNPADALAGSISGMATQTPIIAERAAAFGLGKVPGMLNRVKDSVATGFGLGAVANPGDTKGQVSILQGQERLTNAGKGGAIGVAGQAGGEAMAKAGATIKSAPQTLDKLSKVKAFKAVGAMLKDFRSARGNNSPEAIGETLLKRNIVNAGDSLEDMASKLTANKQEVGQKIGDIYRRVKNLVNTGIDDVTGLRLTPREQKILSTSKLNGQKIAGEARVEILKAFKNNPGNQEAKSKVLSALDDVAAMGDDIDLSDLLEAKSNIDAQINYAKKINDLPIVQQQLKTLRDSVNKAIQKRVDSVGSIVKDKDLIKSLKEANREYGHLATAEGVAKDKISRESANRFFSLGDRLSSGAGATIGVASGETVEDKVKNGLIGFATGAIAGRYGRYSLPMVSRASKRLGEALQKPANLAKYGEPLIEAAKRSPQEFQALLNQLGKDPEFIKLAVPGGK